MADIEAIEVLTQAKERLFECGWSTGIPDNRFDTTTLCLEQSLVPSDYPYPHVRTLNHYDHSERLRAIQYVRAAIGHWTPPSWSLVQEGMNFPLWQWNDNQRSAGEVFDALDRAILIAKEVSVIPTAS